MEQDRETILVAVVVQHLTACKKCLIMSQNSCTNNKFQSSFWDQSSVTMYYHLIPFIRHPKEYKRQPENDRKRSRVLVEKGAQGTYCC